MNSDFIIKNIIFLFIFQIFARTILKKYNDKSEKKHIEDIFKKKYFSNIANQVLENINKDSDGKKGSGKNIFTKISDVNNFIKSKYNEDYIKNELEKNMEEFRKKELVNNKQKSNSFIPNKDKTYKIKCNIIFDKHVKNIILKIYSETHEGCRSDGRTHDSNSQKEFIYNFCENHLIDSLISKYEFILDNYFENEESIYIEIFADGLKINDFDINIQEIDKYQKKSFIIFTVNDKNYPVYFEKNIFDINESSKIHRLDKNDIFFI